LGAGSYLGAGVSDPVQVFYQFGLALTLGVAREIEGDPAAIERAVRVAVGPLA